MTILLPRHLRSLPATKRYVGSLKRAGRLALEGWYTAHDAQYRQASEAVRQRLEGVLEVLAAEEPETIAESRAAFQRLYVALKRIDEDSTAALAEAIVRQPVTLPRQRLALPKTAPTILGAPAPRPKKVSGGQKKYDLPDIRRLIDQQKAIHKLRSNHAALCGILFEACHEADSPTLQAKARAMDHALKFRSKTLPHARALVRAVEDVEGTKLKSLEELLRRDRKNEKQGRK